MRRCRCWGVPMPSEAVVWPAAAVPRAGGTMPRDAGWWALLLPAFLLMSVIYIAPILQVLAISVTEPTTGLGNYERLFTSIGVQRVIGTTLRICIVTTVIALLLGY